MRCTVSGPHLFHNLVNIYDLITVNKSFKVFAGNRWSHTDPHQRERIAKRLYAHRHAGTMHCNVKASLQTHLIVVTISFHGVAKFFPCQPREGAALCTI